MLAIELEHDRVLAAVAEQRAGDAVVRDLFGHPGVRHDREAAADEERRVVRERAQPRVAVAPGPRASVVDHPHAEAEAPRVAADDQRAHFGDRLRQRRELRAADDAIAGRRGARRRRSAARERSSSSSARGSRRPSSRWAAISACNAGASAATAATNARSAACAAFNARPDEARRFCPGPLSTTTRIVIVTLSPLPPTPTPARRRECPPPRRSPPPSP